VLNFPIHALGYLELGKARALVHDQAGARQAYQEFLTPWKDVDLDIPALREAKTAYARMR